MKIKVHVMMMDETAIANIGNTANNDGGLWVTSLFGIL